MNHNQLQDDAASPEVAPALAPRKVASDALLGEAKALVIVHNGRDYLLRLTQNGKLILTA